MQPFAIALLVLLPPLLVIDFLLFGRHPRELTIREALVWSAGWIAAACGFAALVWRLAGAHEAGLFVSVYVLEKSLSADNLIVFGALLASHNIDFAIRQRILTWGIGLALIFRAALLLAGYALLQLTPTAHLIFGALLIGAGFAMLRRQILIALYEGGPPPVRPESSAPESEAASDGHGLRFMLGLLASIAVADLIFALDSIPAAFAVTTEVPIVFSATVFALLGLRALYFVLEHLLKRMRYVQPALGVALLLIGVRMALAEHLEVPHWAPAAVTVVLVVVGMVASVAVQRRRDDVCGTAA